MILTNNKDCYTVTTDAQIDALKGCGFTENVPPEADPPEVDPPKSVPPACDPPKSKKAKQPDADKI